MIQGYRMAGPPPHGEPSTSTDPEERRWPAWLGFVGLLGAFLVAVVAQLVILIASGTNAGQKLPPAASLIASAVQEACFVGAALICAARVKPLHAWQFGLRPTRLWPAVGWAALTLGGFYAALIVYSTLVSTPDQTTADDVGANSSDVAMICAGILFVVLAPIAEEIFFRGFFYGALRTSMGPLPAALIAGVVFGVLHYSTGLDAVPPLILLGVLFCLLYEKTGSLYPCIALHAINNSFAYAGQTNVAPGVAAGFGAAMVAACLALPRIAWRGEPARP